MEFTWKELEEITHAIKQERTVIGGTILSLTKTDEKLKRVQANIDNLIIIKGD